MWKILLTIFCIISVQGCSKKDKETIITENASLSYTVNGINNNAEHSFYNVGTSPEVVLSFSNPVKTDNLTNLIKMQSSDNVTIPLTIISDNEGLQLQVKAAAELNEFTQYTLTVSNAIKTISNGFLTAGVTIRLNTGAGYKDKFPRISNDELLTLVQQQTFKYFWDFAHPVSGLIRERNTSGDIVTTGGSGFGVMAIIVAIERGFITRSEGLARITKMVTFLKEKVTTYKGAYAHWLNGYTGATQPFSAKDNGADIVETSLLFQGLITARQYFSQNDAEERSLAAAITAMYDAVEWNWFRKSDENKLYWHWSPDFGWDMNLPIAGWNESLITYVLAASANKHAIPKIVYDEGWARNGAMKNGNTYYGIQLPLGVAMGGPMFLSQYSFLGINPDGLKDAYADYAAQTRNHALINHRHAITNPNNFSGYSDSVWGLTASDIPNGYAASSPTADRGVIAPTAALASFPYTPEESMKALHYFYYRLGDKLFKEYGFIDAFSLHHNWFAGSFLAINQGPIIIMIENYRSGKLWELFMSAPEIKKGLKKIGFQSPHL